LERDGEITLDAFLGERGVRVPAPTAKDASANEPKYGETPLHRVVHEARASRCRVRLTLIPRHAAVLGVAAAVS
jgi:hypothetical protein